MNLWLKWQKRSHVYKVERAFLTSNMPPPPEIYQFRHRVKVTQSGRALTFCKVDVLSVCVRVVEVHFTRWRRLSSVEGDELPSQSTAVAGSTCQLWQAQRCGSGSGSGSELHREHYVLTVVESEYIYSSGPRRGTGPPRTDRSTCARDGGLRPAWNKLRLSAPPGCIVKNGRTRLLPSAHSAQRSRGHVLYGTVESVREALFTDNVCRLNA